MSDRIVLGVPHLTLNPSDLTSPGTYFIFAASKNAGGELRNAGQVVLHTGKQGHLTPASPRDLAAAILNLVEFDRG